METSYSRFDLEQSRSRISSIIKDAITTFPDAADIPDRNKLSYSNGFYVDVTAVFIDIRDSSKLPEVHRKPALAKIYRSYISECVAVFNSNQDCKEVYIEGDCVCGIFNGSNSESVEKAVHTAAMLANVIDVLNQELTRNSLQSIKCGIGVAHGNALMLQAGKSGSGVKEVVWIGKVLNEASRLCHGANKNGTQILRIGRSVYNKLGAYLKLYFTKPFFPFDLSTESDVFESKGNFVDPKQAVVEGIIAAERNRNVSNRRGGLLDWI